jgi:hypothetical protein
LKNATNIESFFGIAIKTLQKKDFFTGIVGKNRDFEENPILFLTLSRFGNSFRYLCTLKQLSL